MREKGVFLLLQLYLLTCTRIKHNNFLACYWIVPIVRLNEKKRGMSGDCVVSSLTLVMTRVPQIFGADWEVCGVEFMPWLNSATALSFSSFIHASQEEKKEEACNHKQGLGKTTSPIIINTPNCYVKYVLPLA